MLQVRRRGLPAWLLAALPCSALAEVSAQDTWVRATVTAQSKEVGAQAEIRDAAASSGGHH